LKELESVSKELVLAGNDTHIFEGIQEWNDVKQHDFWGYRKYRHGAIPDALKRFEGTDRVTPAAQASCYVDVKKRAGVLRLLSTNRG